MRKLIVTLGIGLVTFSAVGEDWPTVDLIRHSDYQAVNADGSSAYPSADFPVRLRGIVLNNYEDWLDPAPDFQYYVEWYLGGQWEIFVQAWDDPNETYDDGDFGGTSCWMGQNYGNIPWINDPAGSYTDAEWLAELDRINHAGYPDGFEPRAGDLIEIRARAGMNYQGKMNVNEQHINDRDPETGELGNAHDFEIVCLQRGFGLPEPAAITLADLEDETGAFYFDVTRQTGGERYQSTRIEISGVWLDETQGWGTDTDLLLVDGTGRSLTIHLGFNPSFDQTCPPLGTFSVVGILNQAAWTGIGGYYLMAMNAADFDPPLALRGDINGDGTPNNFDISPFIYAVGHDETEFANVYPDGCYRCADVNGDGVVDNFDITPFIRSLQGS
ncbi:MAG: hypothetical protein PVJ57_08950 [Phycisphaerae bacterium]|jgi:hypothetical protein